MDASMELEVQITPCPFNLLISRIALFRAHKGATQMSRTQHTFNLFEALPSLHDFAGFFPKGWQDYPAQISRGHSYKYIEVELADLFKKPLIGSISMLPASPLT